jgi:hypothetical protein
MIIHIDQATLHNKLEIIFRRSHSRLVRDKVSGLYTHIYFPVGWFASLRISLGCVNYEAERKAYHIDTLTICTLFKNYPIARSQCNLNSITGRINDTIRDQQRIHDLEMVKKQESTAIKFNRMLQRIC